MSESALKSIGEVLSSGRYYLEKKSEKELKELISLIEHKLVNVAMVSKKDVEQLKKTYIP